MILVEIAHPNDVLAEQWTILDTVESIESAFDVLNSPTTNIARGTVARIRRPAIILECYIYCESGWEKNSSIVRKWTSSKDCAMLLNCCNDVPRKFFVNLAIDIIKNLIPLIPEIENVCRYSICLMKENDTNKIEQYIEKLANLTEIFGWEYDMMEFLRVSIVSNYITQMSICFSSASSIYANHNRENYNDHLDEINDILCLKIRKHIPLYEITSRL